VCTPALQLVQNGPTGTLPVTPLDPTPPQISNSPTFTDVANEYLDDLDIVGDGYEDLVEDATLALATIDATAVEMDATLDTILALLALDPGTGPMINDFGVFASDQDGIDSLVAQVDPSQLPTLGAIPLVDPQGNGTVTFGGTPATGGVPTAGSPAYNLQVPLPGAGAFAGAPQFVALSGPNPPFTGTVTFQQLPTPQGGQLWYAMVGINPAQDGNFTATLEYDVPVQVTGVTGVVHGSTVVNVVVSG
jgi:hypothetical protein